MHALNCTVNLYKGKEYYHIQHWQLWEFRASLVKAEVKAYLAHKCTNGRHMYKSTVENLCSATRRFETLDLKIGTWWWL